MRGGRPVVQGEEGKLINEQVQEDTKAKQEKREARELLSRLINQDMHRQGGSCRLCAGDPVTAELKLAQEVIVHELRE